MWPEKLTDSWAILKDTRWAHRYDVGEVTTMVGSNETTRYNAFMFPPDPGSVDVLAARQRGETSQEK